MLVLFVVFLCNSTNIKHQTWNIELFRSAHCMEHCGLVICISDEFLSTMAFEVVANEVVSLSESLKQTLHVLHKVDIMYY